MQNCYRLPNRFDPNDIVIDVGANIGCFAVRCLASGAGRVAVVEPHPDNFALLKRNTAPWGGQVGYQRAALFWKRAEYVAIVDRGPQSAMHHVGDDGGNGLALSVPRVTLDDLLPNLRPGVPPAIRLLKLDCEGGEYPGLIEATRLRACREIVVECHPMTVGDAAGSKMTHLDVVARLTAEGFDITATAPCGENTLVWAWNKAAP